ncbi:MAG: TRAP transporter substrate-binding protein DctP [Candidatus Kapabacteria bacterium]|nr:TRAP transporter substrate-binding protein DctP [Candidatus Kapabacteria bacterium]MDW7996834.1 TRAP transporter substrate-binding protein DctP [Bacteroidota bacterium]
MKRRDVLRYGIVGGAAVMGWACQRKVQTVSPTVADVRIRWRLATSWPPNFPIFEHGPRRLAEMLERMSGGRFTIEVDSAGKHKAPFGVFDMVRNGTYDMGHTAAYYWKGKEPVMPLFTTVPFGMNVLEQYAWFFYGGGMQLMERAFARHGLLSFPAGNTGVQMGGWFRKPIRSVEDFRGLKMRIPGLGGEVLARLGAEPITLPAGELYTALEKRVVDAVEWVSPAIDLTMGFQEIAEYYYLGWHEPAAELQYLVNKRRFEELPSDFQAMLTAALKETALDTTSEFFARNAEGLEILQTRYPRVKILRFPDDVIVELRRQTHLLLQEYAARDSLFREVWENQQRFQQRVRRWTEISEQYYLAIR